MHYVIYILGALLLVLPAEYLTRRKLHNVTLRDVLARPRYRFGWVHWVNGVDVVRGCFGVMLLKASFARLSPGATSDVVVVATVAVAALVGLGLKQIFFSYEPDDLLAPIAYLIGLTFGFVDVQVALLGLPLGVVAALGTGSLGTGFVVSAIATGVLGVMFKVSPWVAACPGLFLISPALLAAMLQRRLVMSVRPVFASVAAPLREMEVKRRSS